MPAKLKLTKKQIKSWKVRLADAVKVTDDVAVIG